MYDWANSAFVTTVVAAFLPIYYSRVAASQLPDTVATAYWGYTTAIALAVIAVLSPILGAIADYMGAKKRFLAVFMGFGVTPISSGWIDGGGLGDPRCYPATIAINGIPTGRKPVGRGRGLSLTVGRPPSPK